MDNYQHILSLEAQKRHVDGVICGHIHHADITEMEFGKTYCNCGDWVESCTALVEDETGQLSIIRWLEESHQLLDQQLEPQPDYAEAACYLCFKQLCHEILNKRSFLCHKRALLFVL